MYRASRLDPADLAGFNFSMFDYLNKDLITMCIQQYIFIYVE
jgi:hypothetical protein